VAIKEVRLIDLFRQFDKDEVASGTITSRKQIGAILHDEDSEQDLVEEALRILNDEDEYRNLED